MDWKPKTYPLYDAGVKQPCISKTMDVGNILFLSSFDGRNLETGEVSPKKFEEQMVVCLDNIRSAPEEAGSSMNHLVKN
ncbi:MAG: RidA family protein, partial [Desulfobacterales bacterium]|nr:RidA family protein [Desulfobacterales bacterium]